MPITIRGQQEHPKRLSNYWFVLLIGLSLLFFMIVIGNVLLIGSQFRYIHPSIELLFYFLIISLVFIYIVRPILTVFYTPHILLGDIKKGKIEDKEANEIYKRLIKYGILEKCDLEEIELRRNNNLGAALKEHFDFRDNNVKEIIKSNAKVSFVATAMSQNGSLDALILIITNVRMIKDIIREYKIRPSFQRLIKIYSEVFAAAFVIEQLESHIDDSVLEKCLDIKIPIPFLTFFISSLLQGTGSAFFTLRVGFITKRYLYEGDAFSKLDARKDALSEITSVSVYGISECSSRATGAVMNGIKGFITTTYDTITDKLVIKIKDEIVGIFNFRKSKSAEKAI